ncbi:MAG: DUF1659 domain-containing protein [Cloacibacillus sp.]
MAQVKAISSALRLTLALGEADGKKITKTVSLSKIGSQATAAALSAVVTALAELLAYPVASVKKYDTGLLESE